VGVEKCKDCGGSVSTSASKCPHCGRARTSTTTKGCAWIVALFGGLVLLAMCSQPAPRDATPTISAPATPPITAERIAELKEARLDQLRSWSYRASEPPMGGGTTYTAHLGSMNEFSLGFPYAGPQRGTIMLRQQGRAAPDVLISIERGQIMCHVRECSIDVRFDDGEARTFAAAAPASNDSDMVFVSNSRAFYSALKGADRVQIELVLFQEGTRVIDFDTSKFDEVKWKAARPPSE